MTAIAPTASPSGTAPSRDRPYLPEDSLLRAVQRERSVALSGARALFLQAAHPVAFEGFFRSSASIENPHPRLARTALAVNTVIFGTERQAREVQEIVGTMHARVRGRTRETVGRFPAGTPFRGDDPALLRWILEAFIDSSYRAYERYVRPLQPDEREELWGQWRQVGAIFGLGDDGLPHTYDGFVADVHAMLGSGDLIVTPQARDLARRVILNPPLPPVMLPIKELVNQITIDSLPADLRRQYGFLPAPGRGIAHAAFGLWMRQIGTPLAPRVVREVPEHVIPGPGRDYAEMVDLVSAQLST